jgi:hypothetical protein
MTIMCLSILVRNELAYHPLDTNLMSITIMQRKVPPWNRSSICCSILGCSNDGHMNITHEHLHVETIPCGNFVNVVIYKYIPSTMEGRVKKHSFNTKGIYFEYFFCFCSLAHVHSHAHEITFLLQNDINYLQTKMFGCLLFIQSNNYSLLFTLQ